MFLAKKIIASFLLPPGIFIVLFFWLGWRLYRKKRRGTALGLWSISLLIWALSIYPVSTRLLGPLEKGYAITQPLRGDVIILLGGGIYDNVRDLTGKGVPSNEMMSRIVTAVRVQRQLNLPLIVSGGAVYKGRSAEAPIAGRILTDLGVEPGMIILEEKSRDTDENARYCGDIVRQRGFTSPLLITSAYHMRRSVDAFRRAGIAVTPIPAHFSLGPAKLILSDLLPAANALAGTSRALHEYLGIYWYKLTFWRKK